MPLGRICVVLAGLLASLACGPASTTAMAQPYVPPHGQVFAGLSGGTSVLPYERMVAKHPPVFEDYTTWGTSTAWLASPDSSFRSRLGLEISTGTGYAKPGVISPEGIALGRSDGFLTALNANLARSGRIVYVRIMGEVNGYWNAYSAFSADGQRRGVQNSPHFFVQAWRRAVLILRGGPVIGIDRRLRALGLASVRGVPRARHLPRPKVAFLWVPQDAGSPPIAANAPAVYWPGGEYVDWVGTDFYASYANFGLLDRFYAEFAGKPFVLSEWALYGADDPGFVRALFAWVRTHRRVRMLDYYQGFTRASPANLARYPRSRAALARALHSRRFLAYPPEYAHAHHRRTRPGPPPRPPKPGLPPGPAPGAPPGPAPAPGGAPPLVCVTPLFCVPTL